MSALAFNSTLDGEVSRLFGDVAADDETAVLVLTGAGKAFSAGGDIEMMQRCIDDPNLFLEGLRNGKRLLFGMLDCPKPIIAKVNGEIVTRSDIDRTRQQMEASYRQQGLTGTRLTDALKEGDRNILREKLDQLLLLSKAKELSINVDTEVNKQLADIQRKVNIADGSSRRLTAGRTPVVSTDGRSVLVTRGKEFRLVWVDVQTGAERAVPRRHGLGTPVPGKNKTSLGQRWRLSFPITAKAAPPALASASSSRVPPVFASAARRPLCSVRLPRPFEIGRAHV